MKINIETLTTLIEKNQNNKTILDFLYRGLMSFEEYHQAVFKSECNLKLYGRFGVLGKEDYQEMFLAGDKNRTIFHNSLLGTVNMINRLTAKEGLEPFYDGKVSEEHPYRRQVATAVFDFVQTIIAERI